MITTFFSAVIFCADLSAGNSVSKAKNAEVIKNIFLIQNKVLLFIGKHNPGVAAVNFAVPETEAGIMLKSVKLINKYL